MKAVNMKKTSLDKTQISQIKKIQAQQNLSQKKLADVIGCHESEMSNALTGKSVKKKIAEDILLLCKCDNALDEPTKDVSINEYATVSDSVKVALKDYMQEEKLDNVKLAYVVKVNHTIIGAMLNGKKVPSIARKAVETLLTNNEYLSAEGACLSPSGAKSLIYKKTETNETGKTVSLEKLYPNNKTEGIPGSFYQNVAIPVKIKISDPLPPPTAAEVERFYEHIDIQKEAPIDVVTTLAHEVSPTVSDALSNEQVIKNSLDETVSALTKEFTSKVTNAVQQRLVDLKNQLVYMMNEVDRLAPYEEKYKKLKAQLSAMVGD